MNWGLDFNNIIYDWQNKKDSEKQLDRFSKKQFVFYQIKKGISNLSFPLLLLVQSYNESKRIQTFLANVSKIFDGIILLDDGSNDNTYEMSQSEKLIFKGKKQRIKFNDLENRNLLLDLASFVNYKIAFFLDVDEMFDNRFCNVRQYVDDTSFDSCLIPYIHLWDTPSNYNAQYPSAIEGICFRYKMIRNIGHTQIHSNVGILHFHQAPTLKNSGIASDLLILHYGLLSQCNRKRKYDFYKEEDKDGCQKSYEHFNDNASPLLYSVNDISTEKLKTISNKILFG